MFSVWATFYKSQKGLGLAWEWINGVDSVKQELLTVTGNWQWGQAYWMFKQKKTEK